MGARSGQMREYRRPRSSDRALIALAVVTVTFAVPFVALVLYASFN